MGAAPMTPTREQLLILGQILDGFIAGNREAMMAICHAVCNWKDAAALALREAAPCLACGGDGVPRVPQERECCAIGVYCQRHGWVHGQEAEELRERLEELNNAAVNRVLDQVDARDSLAYLEATNQPTPPDVAPPQPTRDRLKTAHADQAPTCDCCGKPLACPGETAEYVAELESKLAQTLERAETAERERDEAIALLRRNVELMLDAQPLLPSTQPPHKASRLDV